MEKTANNLVIEDDKQTNNQKSSVAHHRGSLLVFESSEKHSNAMRYSVLDEYLYSRQKTMNNHKKSMHGSSILSQSLDPM